MNKRIFEVRQSASLSMRAFGERIGISGPSVARLESGENNPSEQTIRAICSEFHVNRAWLESGIGEMQTVSAFPARLLTLLEAYPALRSMLESVDEALGLEGWQMLNQVVEKAIETKNKKESQ